MIDIDNMKTNELSEKVKELEEFSRTYNMDLSEEINKIKEKIDREKNKFTGKMEAWDEVILARIHGRPTTLDYIERIFTGFIELHGDRFYGDDKAIVGGIGKLNEMPVTIIGQQKGRSTKENIERNFGMPSPEGYRKALRLIKQAEKFKRPVICFVDTPGAFCGIEAEERGQGEAIARCLMEISNIRTPVITVIIGEGGSGGALALACGDRVYMLEHSIYSIISPEGCASILLKDSKRAKEAASIMKLTSKDLYELNIVDGIIKEPIGGAHRNFDEASNNIKEVLVDEINALTKKSIDMLLQERYEKYRNVGI